MGARVTEQLMALGDWTVDLDYNPAVLAELVDDLGRPRKVHFLVYDGASNLLFPPLLQLRRPSAGRDGITTGGRNAMWWLGFDGVGPIDVDVEHPSGQNKLSNGDLLYGEDHWRLGEGWSIADEAAAPSSTSADSMLESDEKFPTQAGWQYTASVMQSRGPAAGFGRLRIRIIFEGRINYPDILPTNWDDQSDTPGDATVSGGYLVLGPCTQYAPLANPTFDASLTAWVQVAGTWAQTTAEHYSGAGSATTAGGGPSPKHLQADANPATAGTVDPFPFGPFETWRFEGAVKGSATADGEVKVQLYLADAAWPANPSWLVIARVQGTDTDKQNWRYEQLEITTPENKTHFVPMLVVYGHTTGNWYFDNVKATRIVGNKARFVNLDSAGLVPERRYKWRAKVTCGPTLTSGSLLFGVTLAGTERPVLDQQSPSIEAIPGKEVWMEWEFTPPSGYFVCQPYIVATDAYGGAFYISEQTLVDQDPTTAYADARSDYLVHAATSLSVSGTAPEGTDSVRVAVVAESEADSYSIDDVSLVRTGVTPSTGNTIVAGIVGGSSVSAGVVDCPETIPFDWRITNMTQRDRLDHYCQVVSLPRREWRLNPDRTLDVATSAELFVDHAPGSSSEVVLLETDLDVPGGIPSVDSDVESRATRIKVIGAERVTVSGRRTLITATAEVPGTPEHDWNGTPVLRTRIVSDSTVDHAGYAQALADDLAQAEAEPPFSIEATLSGIATRPAIGVGDWVYAYKPEAGLEDDSVSVDIEGVTVHPRKLRVLSKTTRLGPSHRIDVRREDGTVFTLTGVKWEKEDATELELGTRLPTFTSDPQGGAASRQYLRDRALTPR